MTQPPRKVEEDEWYAAQTRGDRSELKALVEQQVAYATSLTGMTRCFLRERGTPEHAIVYMPDTRARAPGHVYSPAGVREINITMTCEWCFDMMAAEPEAAPEEKEGKGRR